MQIAYIEPFYSGSHKTWISEYAARSRHSVQVFGLPGVHWKWRMQSGVIALAEELIQAQEQFDLILLSDMADAALFRALLPQEYARTPLVLYFHENQLGYPWSKQDRNQILNRRYFGHLNYTSALTADACVFNSEFHRRMFLDGIRELQKEAPDMKSVYKLEKIQEKSAVLYPGVSLSNYDHYRESGEALFPDVKEPVIIWNHRWDFDKNPQEFFDDCAWLKNEGIPFKLVLCGEQLDVEQEVFSSAKKQFADEILHCGFVDSQAEYASLLWRSDVLPVTSYQDFFGISIVEACYCGVRPLLPYRVAYPDVFDADRFSQFFYRGKEGRRQQLKDVAMGLTSEDKASMSLIQQHVSLYDWKEQSARYDHYFESIGECV